MVADGLALRKDSIEVYLHDVQVSIRPGTINDMNIKFNKETGKYEYEVISNLPVEFDKEEIKDVQQESFQNILSRFKDK